MRSFRGFAAVLLAVALASTAHAADPEDYVLARVGAFVPQQSFDAFNAGLDLEVAAGRAFLPYVAAEVGVGLSRAESDEMWAFHPDDRSPHRSVQRLRIVPLTASVKGILPVGTLQPYLVAGAGLYLTTEQRDPVDGMRTVSDSADAVGFHFGGGATLRLSGSATLTVDARYVMADVRYFDQKLPLEGLRVGVGGGWRF